MLNGQPIPDASRPTPDDQSLVIEEPRFDLVPEWVIDAQIPDSSFRLYSLLLRYGGSTGSRMPSRATLARRMHRSVDAVDRAMRELVNAGIVRVEHRRNGQQHLTNRYHVRTTAPSSTENDGGRRTAATRTEATTLDPAGRTDAATPDQPSRGRSSAATGTRAGAVTPGRGSAGRVAADVRHDPEVLTQSSSPPPTGSSTPPRAVRPGRREVEEGNSLLTECGVSDLADRTKRCQDARQALGKSPNRWASNCLTAALHQAVRTRGWPAAAAVPALLEVAADPQSLSPMRVAEGGPWWDLVPAVAGTTDHAAAAELAGFEQRLAELGGRRPALQASARQELAAEGLPLTRRTVVRRACQILDRQGPTR